VVISTFCAATSCAKPAPASTPTAVNIGRLPTCCNSFVTPNLAACADPIAPALPATGNSIPIHVDGACIMPSSTSPMAVIPLPPSWKKKGNEFLAVKSNL